MDAVVNYPVVWGPVVSVLIYLAFSNLTSKSAELPDLPCIGPSPKSSFAYLRAVFGSFWSVRDWLAEGYKKYSTQDKSYIFPCVFGFPELVVPRSQLQWLVEQPDSVLSTSEVHYDLLQGDYAFTKKEMLEDAYHEHVIHRNLVRRLPGRLMDVWDEVTCSFDEYWGVEPSDVWKDICVFENMMAIIARLSNRLFVGLPLCRNQDYLKGMSDFAQAVIVSMFSLGMTPRFLRPIVGRLVTIPNNRAYRRTAKYTKPMIEERILNIEKKREDPTFEWEDPDDYVSWHYNQTQKDNRVDESTVDMISRRLMPLNFAAIHTTALTITNTLFDLFASDPSMGFVDGIREEATRVYRECDGKWDKAALAKLIKADAAIRESMRVSDFLIRAVTRKVVAPEGITNAKEGWHAPKGTYISVDAHSVQHDPNIFPEPESYDAFRFSRPREEAESMHNGKKHGENGTEELLRLKGLSMVTTGDTFLPFSHGRHACPGRFFVSHELKMLIAYMVMNYEIEPLPVRPPNKWISQNVVPPMKACIRIRRRTASKP